MKNIELKKFVFENLLGVGNCEDFSSEDSLLQLGLDSLKMMRLIAFIEEKFSIIIPDIETTPDQMESLSTIEKLIDRHKKSRV